MFKSTKLILILSCSFLFSSLAQSTLAYDYGYYTITKSDDTICDDIDELVRSTAKDLEANVADYYTDGSIGFDCIDSMKLDPDSNVLVLVPFYKEQYDEFYLKALEPKVVDKLLKDGLLVSCPENGVQGACTPIDDELADALTRSFSESGFQFPTKPFHSMDEIKAYMGMIKPYRELITIIQRSIYRKSPKSEQKLLGKSFVDGQWGDGTQEALETALQMADGFETSDKISADAIKNILFSAFINTNEKVSSAGVDPIAIHGPTNNLTADSDTEKTGGGTPLVTAVDNIKVETLTKKISDLKNKLKIEREKVAAMGVQTIRQLLDAVEKITVNGETKNGENVEINNKDIDYDGCSSLNDLDYSIRDAKLNWHKSGCVEYNVGDLDVDKVTVDDSGIVTVALQEKQAQYITSIKSDTLPALKGLAANCYVELETQDGRKSESSPVDFYYNDDDLYFSVGVKGVGVKGKKMLWEGLNFKLTLSDNEGQKCQLTSDVAIPITTKDKVANQSAPHAIISREGEVILKNLPITKIVGRDLVVFLDTYVGSKGSWTYAFNSSLEQTEMLDVQKRYFGGFMDGLEMYLRSSNEFQRVKVFTSDTDQRNDFRMVIEENIEESDGLSDEISDFFSSYIDEKFKAGTRGFFSDKKQIYKELRTQNPNTIFLSFGSSGKPVETICSPNRADLSEKSYIFDIINTSIIEGLDDDDKVNELEKYVYQCVDVKRVYGIRETKYIEREGVRDFVYKSLESDLEY